MAALAKSNAYFHGVEEWMMKSLEGLQIVTDFMLAAEIKDLVMDSKWLMSNENRKQKHAGKDGMNVLSSQASSTRLSMKGDANTVEPFTGASERWT
jgi:hypothetical protein